MPLQHVLDGQIRSLKTSPPTIDNSTFFVSGSRLFSSKIAPYGRRSCVVCCRLPYWFAFVKPRASPSEKVDRDRVEPLVDSSLLRSHSTTMAVVNGDHGSTKEAVSGDSSTAKKSAHRVNGESHTSNGPVTNGKSHPEVSSLTVLNRVRLVQPTAKYRDGFRRINGGTLNASTSIKSFFDFVANYRLRRMPHKGSRWDKILRWAEYFAAQVALFDESVGPFVSNSKETAQLLWASCRVLLEVSVC